MAREAYREVYFTAPDGRRLYYRDYGDSLAPRVPLLCLAGLTRNSKDFADLAPRLAARRRVICLDLRGRGNSDYDADWHNYHARIYSSDILALLAVAGMHEVIVIGTSLGGVLAMILAVTRPTALRGVVLNDIGAKVEQSGIRHIAGYIGKTPAFADWDQAIRALREMAGPAYPGLGDDAWAKMARGVFREDKGGIRPDYDPALAKAFRADGAKGNLWPFFGALANIPTLLIRGQLSSLLSAATAEKMQAMKPDLAVVTVPGRGHVPLLDEPECTAAIDEFLESL